MSDHPRGYYSQTHPSSDPLRTTLNYNNNLNNQNEIKNENENVNTYRRKSKSSDNNLLNKMKLKSKRNKSLPLLQFEEETNRSRKKKRRYSDFSEFQSSRIRLNGLEIDRSQSPHNKRRRISDISDLFSTDKHSKYQLQANNNIINIKILNKFKLNNFITTKTKIREIINEKDIIIAITKHGLAAAFNRRDLKLLCYLNENQTDEEIKEEIQSLFYNKCDNSLIICSTLNVNKNKKIKVKSIPLRRIELGYNKGKQIFETETISYPGWLEYEDTKNRVLIYDHKKKIYSLWDLNNYNPIYSVRSDNNIIEDMKLTNDGLVQIGPLKKNKRKITIRSLNENKIITHFEININKNETANNTYDFLEFHNGYLYVKHDEKSLLHVYDCRNKTKVPSILNSVEIPDAYLFLKRCNRLLYFQQKVINSNNKNEKDNNKKIGNYGVIDLITGDEFELKQHVKNADNRESIMHIIENQTKIIYYSKFKNLEKDGRKEGIIQINSLENGELFGWIICDDYMMEHKIPLKPRWCLPPNINKEREKIFVNKDPLKRITTIYYNEIQNECYTGNRSGDIHIWA